MKKKRSFLVRGCKVLTLLILMFSAVVLVSCSDKTVPLSKYYDDSKPLQSSFAQKTGGGVAGLVPSDWPGGRIDYEANKSMFDIDNVIINLYYAFEYVGSSKKANVNDYFIEFRNGDTSYVLEYNDGPYSYDDFDCVDTIYQPVNYSHSEHIQIPSEIFTKDGYKIEILIYGYAYSTRENLTRLAESQIYYKTDGTTVELSDSLLGGSVWTTPLVEYNHERKPQSLDDYFEISENFNQERIKLSDDMKEKYDIDKWSLKSYVYSKNKVECFDALAYKDGDIERSTIAIGLDNGFGIKKISVNGDENSLHLKYRGDFTIECVHDNFYTYIYAYLWNDSVVLKFSWEGSSLSLVNAYEILDVFENEEAKERMLNDALVEKTDGDYTFEYRNYKNLSKIVMKNNVSGYEEKIIDFKKKSELFSEDVPGFFKFTRRKK